jgi:hypothetical protein
MPTSDICQLRGRRIREKEMMTMMMTTTTTTMMTMMVTMMKTTTTKQQSTVGDNRGSRIGEKRQLGGVGDRGKSRGRQIGGVV